MDLNSWAQKSNLSFTEAKLLWLNLTNDQCGSLSTHFFPNHSHSCVTHMWLGFNPAEWLLNAETLTSISAPHRWAQPDPVPFWVCTFPMRKSCLEKIFDLSFPSWALNLRTSALSHTLLLASLPYYWLPYFTYTGWAHTATYEKPLLAQESSHLWVDAGPLSC